MRSSHPRLRGSTLSYLGQIAVGSGEIFGSTKFMLPYLPHRRAASYRRRIQDGFS